MISKYHYRLPFLHLFVILFLQRNLVRSELAEKKNEGKGKIRRTSKKRSEREA